MKLRATLTCVYEFEVGGISANVQGLCDRYKDAFMDNHGHMLVEGNTTVNVEPVLPSSWESLSRRNDIDAKVIKVCLDRLMSTWDQELTDEEIYEGVIKRVNNDT